MAAFRDIEDLRMENLVADLFNPRLLTIEGVNRASKEDLLKPLGCSCTPLQHAIRHGVPFDVVLRLLEKVPEALATLNKHGNVALSHVRGSTSPEVALLIAERTPQSALLELDGDGDLPLHCILQNSAANNILRLIIERCTPEMFATANKLGRLPLHDALRVSTAPEIVEMLLEKSPPNALVTAENDGSLPIHSCLTRNVPLALVKLVLRNSPPETLLKGDKSGRLPLHCALAAGCSLDVIKLLLNDAAHAQQNNNGMMSHVTPATAITWPDNDGKLPLHIALSSGVYDQTRKCATVEFLIRRSPTMAFSATDKKGKLPLHCLQYMSSVLFKDAVQMLIARSSPKALLQRDNQGRLPIHAALMNQNFVTDILELLMVPPPSAATTTQDLLFTADHDGQLPLHVAIFHGASSSVVELLLARVGPRRADSMLCTGDNEGRLPIHCWLVCHGRRAAVGLGELLINSPTAPQKVLCTADKHGQLPLHTALLHSASLAVVENLLNHVGPSRAVSMLAQADHQGRLPLHCAFEGYGRRCTLDLVNRLMGPAPYHALQVADNQGRLAIHSAPLFCAGLDVVRHVMKCSPAHALATTDNQGRLPLVFALRSGGVVLASMMAQTPRELRTKADHEGKVLLHHIDRSFSTQSTRLLVDRYPEMLLIPDKYGRLPVHCAVMNSGVNFSNLQILVNSCPESLQVADQDGCLPLHFVGRKHMDTVRLLVNRSGSEALQRTDSDLRLPLHRALLDRAPKEVITVLLDSYPDACLHRDKDGRLPLYHALAYDTAARTPRQTRRNIERKQAMLELLMERCPASVSLVDRFGKCPLHDAVELGAPLPAIQTMIRLYPDAVRHADENGRLVLHCALAENALASDAVIQEIVQAFPGAVLWRDKTNRLALCIAGEAANTSLDTIFTLARLEPDVLVDELGPAPDAVAANR